MNSTVIIEYPCYTPGENTLYSVRLKLPPPQRLWYKLWEPISLPPSMELWTRSVQIITRFHIMDINSDARIRFRILEQMLAQRTLI